MAKSEIILKFDKLIDNVDFHYDENSGIICIDSEISNHFTGFELVKEKDKKEE